MDRLLNKIIYLATERCNCGCIMCNPRVITAVQDDKDLFDRKRKREIPSERMIDFFEKSRHLSHVQQIVVSGGEPFIREDIIEFVLGMERNGKKVLITTNGTFVERVRELVGRLSRPRESLFLQVSLDGFEETHERIRNRKGIFGSVRKTLEFLRENEIGCSINTVVQPENYAELFSLRKYSQYLGIPHFMSVLFSNDDNPFSYTPLESDFIMPFLSTTYDKKYLMTSGNYRIVNCHAGWDSLVINPYGLVYPCATIMNLKNSDDFLIGDLREESFDSVFESERMISVCTEGVRECSGCYNGCEMQREVLNFDYRRELRKEDLESFSSFITNKIVASSLYFDDLWFHEPETRDGISLRWVRGAKAKIFLKAVSNNHRMFFLKCLNLFVPGRTATISVYLNGALISADLPLSNGLNYLRISIPIRLREGTISEIEIHSNFSEVIDDRENKETSIGFIEASLL